MGREINNVFSQEKFPKSSWLQKDLSAIFPPKLDLVDPPQLMNQLCHHCIPA